VSLSYCAVSIRDVAKNLEPVSVFGIGSVTVFLFPYYHGNENFGILKGN